MRRVAESGEYTAHDMFGARARVKNAAGQDMRGVRSESYTLENMLQKKVRLGLASRIDGRPIAADCCARTAWFRSGLSGGRVSLTGERARGEPDRQKDDP